MQNVHTSWVKPPEQIGGLDHLGSQAPCINIYSELLPGVTNVTDRARYYSLYPWIIFCLDKAGFKNGDDFIERFRRADCLLTLISLRHAIVTQGKADTHQAALVGSIQLSLALKNLVSGQKLKLSEFTNRDKSNSKRYFKNALGGFGQYYFGTLRDLQIISGTAQKEVQLVNETGGKIAQAVSSGVPETLFWQTVENDEVSLQALDSLSSFCHCQLSHNKKEHTELLNLFTSSGSYANLGNLPETIHSRKMGLGFLVRLATEFAEHSYDLTIESFRGSVYTGHLPNSTPLKVGSEMTDLFANWSAYQRNELLSVALQGIFFSILRRYRDEILFKKLRLPDIFALNEWFWEVDLGREILNAAQAADSFSSFSESVLSQMPELKDWGNELHEIQRAEKIIQLSEKKSISKDDLHYITLSSVLILSALHGRRENQEGYSTNIFPHAYFLRYPINLDRFLDTAKNSGVHTSTKNFLKTIGKDWCLEAHIKVALRKLRQQSQSTFRFRPTEIGVELIGESTPVYSSPRFRQAMRILEDLQALNTETRDKADIVSPGIYAPLFL